MECKRPAGTIWIGFIGRGKIGGGKGNQRAADAAISNPRREWVWWLNIIVVN
jgi:hypothetical protein